MSRQYLHFRSVVQVHFYDLFWTLPLEYSTTDSKHYSDTHRYVNYCH